MKAKTVEWWRAGFHAVVTLLGVWLATIFRPTGFPLSWGLALGGVVVCLGERARYQSLYYQHLAIKYFGRFMRSSEKQYPPQIAAILPVINGLIPLTYLLPEREFWLVVWVLAFVDPAARVFGVRVGRHQLGWNPDKTWEGMIGGWATALVICLAFRLNAATALVVSTAAALAESGGNNQRSPLLGDNFIIPVVTGIVLALLL